MSFIKNLFKEVGVKDVITLFHSPSSQASLRARTLLTQTAAAPAAQATIDQASSHGKPGAADIQEFSLDVQEQPPTPDQLASILQYLGPGQAGSVVKGASGTTDALKIFRQDAKTFERPVIVDWTNGKAVVGGEESAILSLLRARPQK